MKKGIIKTTEITEVGTEIKTDTIKITEEENKRQEATEEIDD